MDYQALDIGHIGKQREDLEAVDELPGYLLAALDHEGEDRAASLRKVLLIELVFRMAFE